jgi:hemerythrin
MSMVQWNITLLLGIEEIDKHHKHLVDLLNLTYDEYKNRASAERVRHIVEELVEYSYYHFAAEERWMSETSYPELQSHKAEHDIFSTRVRELHANYRLNNSLPLDVVSFLSNWFAYHIVGTDKKFGDYVDGRKLRQRMTSLKPAP